MAYVTHGNADLDFTQDIEDAETLTDLLSDASDLQERLSRAVAALEADIEAMESHKEDVEVASSNLNRELERIAERNHLRSHFPF